MSKLRFTECEKGDVQLLLGIIMGLECSIECIAGADDRGESIEYDYFLGSIMSAAKRALLVCDVYRFKNHPYRDAGVVKRLEKNGVLKHGKLRNSVKAA